VGRITTYVLTLALNVNGLNSPSKDTYWQTGINGPDRCLQSILSSNSTTYILSAAHGTFSKIGHILGNKANLNKYKKIEITPCILSDHNAIKTQFNNKRNSRK
jgi:hypothetical protein